MNEQRYVEIYDTSKINLEDIKGGYDPSKAGFDMKTYLALDKKAREKIFWKEADKFFQSPFNGGTIESFLEELKYDSRYTEGSTFLLFTEGRFHSVSDEGFTQTHERVFKKAEETNNLWFYHHLRGYGFEHYLDGICGFGGPYSTRIDIKK